MKKILFFLIVAMAIGNISYGQGIPFRAYLRHEVYRFPDTAGILKSEVFTSYLSEFGFAGNNDLVWKREETIDTSGTLASHYQQFQNGYYIEGTSMTVISRDDIVKLVFGFTLPKINVDVSSPIGESDALSAALSYINAPPVVPDVPQGIGNAQ